MCSLLYLNLPPLACRFRSLLERCWLLRRLTTMMMITITNRNNTIATHSPMYIVIFSLFSASDASEMKKITPYYTNHGCWWCLALKTEGWTILSVMEGINTVTVSKIYHHTQLMPIRKLLLGYILSLNTFLADNPSSWFQI